MVTRLQLPRDTWQDHPNYPQQLLLLGAHQRFRVTGQMLIDRAHHAHRRASTLNSFSWWKSAMSRHEHYEEAKLYPFLEHRWGLDCAALEAGHEALAKADARVRAADSTDMLVAALTDHQAILTKHLDAEERLVIPALLELDRAEFDIYTRHSLSWAVRTLPCHAGDGGCAVCSPYTDKPS